MGSCDREGSLKGADIIKVIVFDFDGTLIDSNKLKYDAFFSLFPKDDFHKRIVTDVLGQSYEESRYIILRKIVRRIVDQSLQSIENEVNTLSRKYNSLVLSGAKHCNEKLNAEEVLDSLSLKFPIYLSSTTPETSLKEIVGYRKWTNYFRDIFGYPRKKSETLLEIIRREQVKSDEILVIGDGESDRQSAFETGCRFFQINGNTSLKTLIIELT